MSLVPVFALAAVCSALGADVVSDWNAATLNAIRFANTPPPTATRTLALLHVAIYDAVNAIAPRGPAYRVTALPPSGASTEAAVASSARTILVTLYPSFSATWEARYRAQIDGLSNRVARDRGVAWGREVALAILQSRSEDGSQFGIDYDPSPGPGRWEPTPPLFASALLPNWAVLRPFALEDPVAFRPPPPPPLGSPEWAEELHQVKSLGAAVGSTRTPEQTEIAHFWADGPGTETPPGHWNRIAQDYAEAMALDLHESARLFALLNLALADAAIVAWDSKYTYELWRPVTAIRAAATDGNAATEPDPAWTPLLATPPFPEYVSGHSTFSAAAAAVLRHIHGSDAFSFTTTSDGSFGVVRTFSSFSQAAEEAGWSRIYGGIHFASANLQGQEAGRRVGAWVAKHLLVPFTAARLEIDRKGDSIRLHCPRGYNIQTAASLGSTTWSTLEAETVLTTATESAQRFFRLVPRSPGSPDR